MTDRSPDHVVVDFLQALSAHDLVTALPLLAADVQWRNTGLPTLRGGRVARVLRGMVARNVDFAVEFHELTVDGTLVITRRTDWLAMGPVRQEFRVDGTFEVRDGQILVWDDHFSWIELLRSTRLRRG